MEISELTDAISSDDYEEGEILDEDSLFDNVSSLEEFSGSDTELKSHENIASVVIKKKLPTEGRKEKLHRRKEHKCKEDSICRKERSGKHCYARIRKGKPNLEINEKVKIVESNTTCGNEIQNQKKKQVILSPIYDTLPKHSSRRLPAQKDLHEKENRCGHKYLRYYECHKTSPHRPDKKQSSEKQRKHFETGSTSRSHDFRKHSRSQIPKLSQRSQIKTPYVPRGTTSLLKRLVGSGSIGVKTPKEIEEPKKDDCTDKVSEEQSTINIRNNVTADSIKSIPSNTINNLNIQESINNKKEISEQQNVCTSYLENQGLNDPASQEINIDVPEIHGNSNPPITSNATPSENSSNIKSMDAILNVSETQNQDSKIVLESTQSENSGEICLFLEHASTAEEEHEVASQVEDSKIIALKSFAQDSEETVNVKKIDTSSHSDDNQEIDDIDELHLRLEALRTAMIRKHKERKKKGFICRKKSTLEDDSFTEYVLSRVEKENSLSIKIKEDSDVCHSNYNGVNNLGDLLTPEDMVIDKNDKGCDIDNILENFTYPSDNSMENSTSTVPVSYVAYAGPYQMYSYPEFNSHLQFPPFQETRRLMTNESGNIPENFKSYEFSNTQKGATDAQFPQSKGILSNVGLQNEVENYSSKKDSLENCLKEINSNKKAVVDRNKRIRRISRCKRRKKYLNNRKWNSYNAMMKRKLEGRESLQLKRRKKDLALRNMKLLRTQNEDQKEESDEETALRELALKSVKERERKSTFPVSLKGSEMSDSHEGGGSLPTNEDHILEQNLHIDIDNNTIVKPIVSCDSEGNHTNLSFSEVFDDIDEDILRAQLLTSLSNKIPIKENNASPIQLPKFIKKQTKAFRRADYRSLELLHLKRVKLSSHKVIKANLKKNAKSKTYDLSRRKILRNNASNFIKKTTKIVQKGGQNPDHGPIVPKFIISLKEESSSDDEAASPTKTEESELGKSIDLFLQEARIENDLKQSLLDKQVKEDSSHKDGIKSQDTDKEIKITDQMDNKIVDINSTPQVLRHLPAWQQEEYRRLKRQIAEKEKLLKAAKEKVLSLDGEECLKEKTIVRDVITNSTENNGEDNAITSKSTENMDDACLPTLENAVDSTASVDNLNLAKEETKTIGQPLPKQLSPKKTNDSSKIVEEINLMEKMVAHLEDEMTSFRSLNKEIVQKKKELLLTKLNVAQKKKYLFEIRKKLTCKQSLINLKIEQDSLNIDISKISQNDGNKQSRRDLELCRLKMREYNLKTKMIFDEIGHTELNRIQKVVTKGKSPLDKSKMVPKIMPDSILLRRTNPIRVLKIKKNLVLAKNEIKELDTLPAEKLSSEKPTENWDPFVPICPFDLAGVCKDEECTFQHIKTT